MNDNIYQTEGILDLDNPSGLTNFAVMYTSKDRNETESILNETVEPLISINNNLPIKTSYSEFSDFECIQRISSATLNDSSKIKISDLLPDNIYQSLREFLEKFTKSFFIKTNMSLVNIYFPEINYGYLNFKFLDKFSIDRNVYLIGECTGKIIGILQSELSGIICAKDIINEYR